MLPLLAADEPPALVPLLISAVGVLAGVVAVLFWQLLKAKDSKFDTATDLISEANEKQERVNTIVVSLGDKVERVAKGLETALDERDEIVREGMQGIREIQAGQTEIKSALGQLLRERTP